MQTGAAQTAGECMRWGSHTIDGCYTCAESSFLTPLVSPRSCEYTLDSRTRMLLLVPCSGRCRVWV